MGFLSVSRGGGLFASVDARAVGRAMGAYPEHFAREVRKAFVRGGAVWERRMKLSFGGYASGGADIHNRSGNLRRTIQYRVGGRTLRALALTLQVGDNRTSYAHAMERGAVIQPRHGSYLTVPMPYALTPSGVIRGDALIRGAGNDRYTDRGPTKIVPVNSRLYVTDGEGKRLRFLYVLKEQVTIPGPDTDGSSSRLGAEFRARVMISDTLTTEVTQAALRAWEIGRLGG